MTKQDDALEVAMKTLTRVAEDEYYSYVQQQRTWAREALTEINAILHPPRYVVELHDPTAGYAWGIYDTKADDMAPQSLRMPLKVALKEHAIRICSLLNDQDAKGSEAPDR